MTSSPVPPQVLVLLATFNGARWLEQQLDSIASQEGVRTRIVASDDGSSDDTVAILDAYSRRHALARLPSCEGRFGNANRNFMRLIADADVGEADYVALSDQDDIWMGEKLQRAIRCIERQRLDAYSSDVEAFWPDGRRKRLGKAGRARTWDHLFESAGPGCSFVFSRRRFLELQAWVRANRALVDTAPVHDWLLYAYGRSREWRWHIDPRPGLLYRQHASNEIGANVGTRAALVRVHRMVDGTYAADVLAIAHTAGIVHPLLARLQRMHWRDRMALVCRVGQFRRRWSERVVLAVMFLAMRPAAPATGPDHPLSESSSPSSGR